MKTAILYSALTRLTPQHQRVRGPAGQKIYIRMAVVAKHYSEALDYAKRRKGETLLNCVPLDDQVTA